MKVENWNGYDIRFVDIDGEWWAVLKDICDALGLKSYKVSQRLEADMLRKITVASCDITTKDGRLANRARHTQKMLVVNEVGIYQTLFASRKLEARKFRLWTGDVLKKLRKHVGLEGYEVMRMTDLEN